MYRKNEKINGNLCLALAFRSVSRYFPPRRENLEVTLRAQIDGITTDAARVYSMYLMYLLDIHYHIIILCRNCGISARRVEGEKEKKKKKHQREKNALLGRNRHRTDERVICKTVSATTKLTDSGRTDPGSINRPRGIKSRRTQRRMRSDSYLTVYQPRVSRESIF